MRPTYTGTIKPAPPEPDGRLSAPAAARNLAPILAVLQDHMPAEGRAVEIASGTGQHCAAFAEAFPRIHWQPTDVAPERLASIDAWADASGRQNIARAVPLNVEQTDWPFEDGSAQVLFLANLLHLVSEGAAEAVVRGGAKLLAPDGRYFIYGPFLRSGSFASDGDASFHASLRQQDPAIGYKDVDQVAEFAGRYGLEILDRRDMPANNLMFVLGK